MATNNRPLLLGRYAGFITRGAALIIDIVIVSVAVLVINWIISLPLNYFFSFDLQACVQSGADRRSVIFLFCQLIRVSVVTVIFVTPPLYFATLISLNGQTIGKYLMGLRVVRVDGEPMTFFGSLLRWFGYFLSAIPFGLGFFVVLVNEERRAFHDRLVGTCVIYSWRARQNELLVDRVARWFESDGKSENGGTDGAKPTSPLQLSSIYELVVIAIPSYAQLQTMLMLLESSVRDGEIEVINTAVMVKGIDGHMGVVAISDLTIGESALKMVDVALSVPAAQLDQIRADAPADSFVIILLIKDEWLNQTLRSVSRRAPAMLAHYDVGDHPETLTADDGLHPDLVSVQSRDR